jgi:hypothetical protein
MADLLFIAASFTATVFFFVGLLMILIELPARLESFFFNWAVRLSYGLLAAGMIAELVGV